MSRQSRQLWQSPPVVAQNVVIKDGDSNNQESFNDIFQRFSLRPAPRSLLKLCSNALVVGQEFSLACFLLARHRVALEEEERYQLSTVGGGGSGEDLAILALQQQRVDQSTLAMFLALSVAVIYSARSNNNNSASFQQDRKQKVKQRTTDAFLLAVLLRFVASVLRTLTASYSSDTVQALAIAGMIVHVLACDYSYANGKEEPGSTAVRQSGMLQKQHHQQQRRPIFRGGTISLNAALFSTTLIVSRLSSNLTAYFFVTLAIIVFCFYPATRHAIAATYHPSTSPALWIVTAAIAVATVLLLEQRRQIILFVSTLVAICLIVPGWKYILQRHKVLVRGPWDIPSVAKMQLDCTTKLSYL